MGRYCFILLLFFSCEANNKKTPSSQAVKKQAMIGHQGLERATFAGGCFWCTEAVFLQLAGVQSVLPGYIGGHTESPTYDDICTGTTGHAEAIQIIFDPQIVSYITLLDVFFATHDPTTLNRQGNDIGTQYRSEIFYHSEKQKEEAMQYIVAASHDFPRKIVTKVSTASTFYVAEDYHKNYYNRNKEQGYCSYVITPKVDKVRKYFSDKLKQR